MSNSSFTGTFIGGTLKETRAIAKDLEKALTFVAARYAGKVLFTVAAPKSTRKTSKGKATKSTKPAKAKPASQSKKAAAAKRQKITAESLFGAE